MPIISLIAGIALIVGGILVVRNFEDVDSFFRNSREQMFGEWAVKKPPQPEIMRRVGIGWIVFGVFIVVIAVLAITGAVSFPLH